MLDSVPAPKLGYVVTGSQREAGYSGSYGYAYGYDDRATRVTRLVATAVRRRFRATAEPSRREKRRPCERQRDAHSRSTHLAL